MSRLCQSHEKLKVACKPGRSIFASDMVHLAQFLKMSTSRALTSVKRKKTSNLCKRSKSNTALDELPKAKRAYTRRRSPASETTSSPHFNEQVPNATCLLDPWHLCTI